jgi:hypothetical protein
VEGTKILVGTSKFGAVTRDATSRFLTGPMPSHAKQTGLSFHIVTFGSSQRITS